MRWSGHVNVAAGFLRVLIGRGFNEINGCLDHAELQCCGHFWSDSREFPISFEWHVTCHCSIKVFIYPVCAELCWFACSPTGWSGLQWCGSTEIQRSCRSGWWRPPAAAECHTPPACSHSEESYRATISCSLENYSFKVVSPTIAITWTLIIRS